MQEECMWCGGKFPFSTSIIHEYIESTPGCWDAFNELLAREYADPKLFQIINRMTVDTYAVQHPGKPTRKAIQSVIAHLVSLYYSLEMNYSSTETTKEITKFVNKKFEMEWLEPPSFTLALNVSDVLGTKSA
jgi:hypothetical protein